MEKVYGKLEIKFGIHTQRQTHLNNVGRLCMLSHYFGIIPFDDERVTALLRYAFKLIIHISVLIMLSCELHVLTVISKVKGTIG